MTGPQPHAARPPGWEHFEHVADVGVRGWGPSLAAASGSIPAAVKPWMVFTRDPSRRCADGGG